MSAFPVRTPDQLALLLQGFRKQAGLTQGEVALRLGVSQQSYSAMERNAAKVGMSRMLRLLQILGVEMQLNRPSDGHSPAVDPAPDGGPDMAPW